MRLIRDIYAAIVVTLLAAPLEGCLGPESEAFDDSEVDDAYLASEPLKAKAMKKVKVDDFAHQDALIHGIAGDAEVVFVTQPFAGRVVVLDRDSGAEVGQIPAPPEGFALPFSVRVASPGHLVVLDPGGFPDPNIPSVARVYDYSYTFDHNEGLSATLTSTVRFDNLPVIFAEDVEVLPGGRKVVSESILGVLWMIEPDGTIRPGIAPVSFAPGDAIPSMAPCIIPDTMAGGVLFRSAGNFGPGVNALAERDGYLYFGSTCAGGIHRVPVASLSDTRAPYQRAADITMVAPKVGEVDILHGIAFDRWRCEDDSLYAAEALNNRVVRIDVTTGQRTVIADDPALFSFPVSLQFLPGPGRRSLVVASDQEHLLSSINQGIDHDMVEPPFIMAEIKLHPNQN